LASFGLDHRELFERWQTISNYICLLQIDNEEKLATLLWRAKELGIVCSEFREPDYGNSLTAICLEPGVKSKKLVSGLKLAFR
jgi:hypothetical protein